MKTITHFFGFYKSITPLQVWKGLNSFLNAQLQSSDLWQLRQSYHGVYSLVVQKLKSLNLWTMTNVAVKDALTGLDALLSSASTNARILIGLGLVGIVTPLSACTHLLFDQNDFVEKWYHVNNFYLFMLLGPYLAGFFLTLGVFFLFPKDSKRAYILIVPMAYLIGKIGWLYFTTTNAEYWAVPHWSFFAMGACISMVIFMSAEWLMWRKFHRADSFEARQKGLYQIADDVDSDKWKSMMMETLRQKYEFSQKF
jgi:hypothetical protein